MIALQEFQDNTVRDLYWAVSAEGLLSRESLVSVCSFKQSLIDEQWFRELDQTPLALHAHMQDINHFLLGAYFEGLWEFFLVNNPHTDLLAKNIQVFRTVKGLRETAGEFDFLYFCKQRNLPVHLEVAIKFYLAYPNTAQDVYKSSAMPELCHWLGPQSNDRLDLKADKLLHAQSQLSELQEGREVLQKLSPQIARTFEQDHAVVKEIAMPGRLFSPFSELALIEGGSEDCSEDMSEEKGLNPQHLKGRWCKVSELSQALDLYQTDLQWQQLLKPFWLAPCVLDNRVDELRQHGKELPLSLSDLPQGLLVEEMASRVIAANRPLLFTCFDKESWWQQQSLFIVPDNWPNN